MKFVVFCYVKTFSLVEMCRCVGGTYCLYFLTEELYTEGSYVNSAELGVLTYQKKAKFWSLTK